MVAAKHSNKAYSYIRFSTPEQAKGDSLRRQTELSARYAREHGLDLDDKLTFRDLGKSGFKGKNVQEGELGHFIKAVENEKVKRGSYLLVENLDRISRQPARMALRQLERIVELGITLVTLHDHKVYTEDSLNESFTDLMYALMVLQRGHEESATKSKRVKAAWAAKRQRAAENGAPMTGAVPAWITKDAATGSLKLHPARSKVVRKIFEEASKGVGHHSIAKRLNEEKVPLISHKKNSQAWWPSYVLKILGNPAVIGHYQPHKMNPDGKRVPEGDVMTDYYPRVVSDTLYYKVRDKRASKRNPSGPKGSNGGNLFTGLARCHACQGAMHKISKGEGPKGGTYLVCSNALRGNGCKYETWRMDDFEIGVLDAISEKIDWNNLSRRIEDHSTVLLAQLEKVHSGKRIELGRVELGLRSVSDNIDLDISEGHGISPLLTQKRRKLEQEQAALLRDIADVQEQLAIERDKAARAGVSAEDAEDAFREWLQKYSIAAGRKRSIPKKPGITEGERRDARERLKVILADLVHTIWCCPYAGADASEEEPNSEIILVFRHGPEHAVTVMPGGFTVFTENE